MFIEQTTANQTTKSVQKQYQAEEVEDKKQQRIQRHEIRGSTFVSYQDVFCVSCGSYFSANANANAHAPSTNKRKGKIWKLGSEEKEEALKFKLQKRNTEEQEGVNCIQIKRGNVQLPPLENPIWDSIPHCFLSKSGTVDSY